MAHFSLSLIILVAAFALAWRARTSPGPRRLVADGSTVWSVPSTVPLGALTIFAGTAATAAGPTPEASRQVVHRLHFKGADTLDWTIHQHATIAALFGVAVIGVWFLQRRRGASAQELEPVTVLGVLLAAQGLVGSVQYELKLPSEMVWVHVCLATVTWLVLLWTVAAAGRRRRARSRFRPAAQRPARASWSWSAGWNKRRRRYDRRRKMSAKCSTTRRRTLAHAAPTRRSSSPSSMMIPTSWRCSRGRLRARVTG